MLFFFQAEDGIRDRDVTGVQTCALPISRSKSSSKKTAPRPRRRRGRQENIRICLFELPWFGWTRRRARTQYRHSLGITETDRRGTIAHPANRSSSSGDARVWLAGCGEGPGGDGLRAYSAGDRKSVV